MKEMAMKSELMDSVFFKEFLENEKMMAATTVRAYGIMLNAFLKENPEIDNYEHYNDFIIKKSFKKRSYYAYYVLINYINFKFKDNRKLKTTLIENLRKPKMALNIKRERRNLEPEKILEIISRIKEEKHQIIALIQKLTGLRAGDILRIKKGRILTETYKEETILRIAAVGKREKRVVVEIFDKVAQEAILSYINNLSKYHLEDYYFIEISKVRHNPGVTFVQLYLNNFNHYFADLKQALNSCGIMKEEFATHDFRRDFAKKVWMKYKNLLILQKILGHSDPKTTTRYLNLEGWDMIDVHKEMQK